jgi:hypothetical protein
MGTEVQRGMVVYGAELSTSWGLSYLHNFTVQHAIFWARSESTPRLVFYRDQII